MMDMSVCLVQMWCIFGIQLVSHISAQRAESRGGMCGSIPNNPSTTICCNGLIYVRSGAQPGCCGNVGYDARNHLCCANSIVRKDQFKVPRCCGNQAYDMMKGNCISGNMVEKKTDLGSHCCMTDSGWKCCNKGENCCSYTGSGQVEITGFRPVCCERGSNREKAECCAKIMETTGILPSCCQKSALKPKCCKRWDGRTECCSVYGSCCANNGNGAMRGVPIRRDPTGQLVPRPRPTERYRYPSYYTTKKAPMVPQCCLAFSNRPSCCSSLHISATCCSNRDNQAPDRGIVDNEVNRGEKHQLPDRGNVRNKVSGSGGNLKYCCSSTRRTCCTNAMPSRVSKVTMPPCCYGNNRPRCCYTSQANSPECCRSSGSSRSHQRQSNYLPSGRNRDANQALEAKYSQGGDILLGGEANGDRSRGVSVTPDSNGQTVDTVSYNRGADRSRVNGRPNYNPWTTERTGKTINSGREDDIYSHRGSNQDEIRENEGESNNLSSKRRDGEMRITQGRDKNVGSDRWTDERNQRQRKIQQENNRRYAPPRYTDIKKENSVTTATTIKYAYDLLPAFKQNDILAYENCCYLPDRRVCCKEAYMATGTLPYCCSASIETENMKRDKDMKKESKESVTSSPGYQSKIKIAQPDPEPKFIPDYAPFGNKKEDIISGIINEISMQAIPVLEDLGKIPISKETEKYPIDREMQPGIIKAIVVDSHSQTTTTVPTYSETEKSPTPTESSYYQHRIPNMKNMNNNIRMEKKKSMGDFDAEQRYDPGGSPVQPHVEEHKDSVNESDDSDQLLSNVHRLPQIDNDITSREPTPDNGRDVVTTSTEIISANQNNDVDPLSTLYPIVDLPNGGDIINGDQKPHLNNSLSAPSNIVGQDIKNGKVRGNGKPQGNIHNKTIGIKIHDQSKSGWINKENIPFENEYQQPDTLDNPFPYNPSAKNDFAFKNPTVPTEQPEDKANDTLPNYDAIDPNLNPEVYNYYVEERDYPEYMMCGDEPYMMNVYICCDGVLRYRYGVRPSCCGTEAYDEFTYKCCDGVIMRSCDPGYKPVQSAWGSFV